MGAWFAAGASVTAPFVALAGSPFPLQASSRVPARQVILVRRTIRRVVVTESAPAAGPVAAGPATTSTGSAPQVRYVYVGGGTVSGGGSSAATTRCSGC
jgi:hypothetical protein